MNQSPASPTSLGVRPTAQLSAALLTQAFVWMFGGLLLTSLVAYFVQSNPRLLQIAYEWWFLLFFGQLALVVAITAVMRRISATVALLLFFIYAASVGLTVGLIVAAYTEESVAAAFFSAAALFGAAAIYGAVTKRTLVGLGPTLFIGVIGLIVASVVNMFFALGPVSLAISIIGVVIFTALTAYDVKRIASGDYAAAAGSMEKAAVFSALALYLDFINIFLFLLRILGSRS
jgi:FtsH-binding integral membrane protein